MACQPVLRHGPTAAGGVAAARTDSVNAAAAGAAGQSAATQGAAAAAEGNAASAPELVAEAAAAAEASAADRAVNAPPQQPAPPPQKPTKSKGGGIQDDLVRCSGDIAASCPRAVRKTAKAQEGGAVARHSRDCCLSCNLSDKFAQLVGVLSASPQVATEQKQQAPALMAVLNRIAVGADASDLVSIVCRVSVCCTRRYGSATLLPSAAALEPVGHLGLAWPRSGLCATSPPAAADGSMRTMPFHIMMKIERFDLHDDI